MVILLSGILQSWQDVHWRLLQAILGDVISEVFFVYEMEVYLKITLQQWRNIFPRNG